MMFCVLYTSNVLPKTSVDSQRKVCDARCRGPRGPRRRGDGRHTHSHRHTTHATWAAPRGRARTPDPDGSSCTCRCSPTGHRSVTGAQDERSEDTRNEKSKRSDRAHGSCSRSDRCKRAQASALNLSSAQPATHAQRQRDASLLVHVPCAHSQCSSYVRA